MAEEVPGPGAQRLSAGRDVLGAGRDLSIKNTYNFGWGSGRRSERFRVRADEALEKLAEAVQEQWRQEERLRRINDPVPLPIRWTEADPVLSDHAPNITRSGIGSLELDGSLTEVVDAFESIPSGRLVMIGRPGAGKTVFALRFTLDMLQRRQEGGGGPVPVIFGLHTWNPGKQALHDWMAVRLATDYPWLRQAGKSGVTVAAELIRRQSVIPVLDGLDEIAPALRPDALRALNRGLDQDAPVIVTCREAEYRALVNDVDVLTSAAVVRLLPLGFGDVADYLPRTTRKIRSRDAAEFTTKWEPVLARMRAEPDAPECRRLRDVLETPLMISLARAIYSDTGALPDFLLDGEFADQAAIEHHLLDVFVPAVFEIPVTERTGVRQRPWSPEDSQRWLCFLARHLARRKTRDLEWWRLSDALPPPARWLAPGLIVWIVVGGIFGGIGPISSAVANTEGVEGWSFGCLAAIGFMLGLAIAMVRSSRQGSAGFLRSQLAIRRLAFTAAAGLTMGIVLGSFAELEGVMSGSDAVVVNLAYSFLGGIAVGVVLGSAGIDARQMPTTTPLRLGRRLRAITRRLPYAVGIGLLNGFFISLILGASWGLGFGAVQAFRIHHIPVFPPGGSRVHNDVDGDHYVDYPDGLKYVVRHGGGRVVETIAARRLYAFPWGDGSTPDYFLSRQECIKVDVVGSGGNGACRPTGLVEATFYTQTGQYGPSGYDDNEWSGWISMDVHSGGGDLSFYDQGVAGWLQAPSIYSVYDVGNLAGELALIVFGPSVLIGCLLLWLEFPADAAKAVSPASILKADRGAAIFRSLVIWVIGFAVYAVFAFAVDDGGALALDRPGGLLMVAAVIILGALAFALSAWARFQVARLWLAARGKLPWRLMVFLQDAHSRGALRQAGAAYQFRHVRLQEQLAEQASK
ncbi:MAG: NACHT domain-containing protein [Streptosporangiales bacterium]|nr:NACHT domain-containing protein [Streptosporangiales bacterium]